MKKIKNDVSDICILSIIICMTIFYYISFIFNYGPLQSVIITLLSGMVTGISIFFMEKFYNKKI